MKMGNHPVHAAPEVEGHNHTLKSRLLHHGERDLHTKVNRFNDYSSSATGYRIDSASTWPRLKILIGPPAAFLKEYLLRRHFLNGWAGFIAARSAAFHSFLKHAKVLEAQRKPTPKDD